ncbi:hypothetical protein [Limnohabitans sp. DM1]|uniref:hypothetical protein n=1 Tax=Limnohabitans sp. DM1 TaxID=1597955 RepID=UPI000A71126E|nr:hypothetical protein [Limnohabitans sp. DM1]
MNKFYDILVAATENISRQYFSTKIIVDDYIKSVYRERIYCYELYHQIRLKLKCDLTMGFYGEYDKSGSSLYERSALNRIKPDFLIHSPGNVEENLLAMEVKSSDAKRRDIKSDINKLIKLKESHNFKFCIYLIYGDNALEKGGAAAEFVGDKFKSEIKIFIHRKAGERAFALDDHHTSI